MNLLLDTHVILWALTDDEKLTSAARAMIEDPSNLIFFSSAAIWEIESKHERHPEQMPFSGETVHGFCKQFGMKELTVKSKHVFQMSSLQRNAKLPKHNDPFDKMMLCQAKAEGIYFLTHDQRIGEYDESCVIKI